MGLQRPGDTPWTALSSPGTTSGPSLSSCIAVLHTTEPPWPETTSDEEHSRPQAETGTGHYSSGTGSSDSVRRPRGTQTRVPRYCCCLCSGCMSGSTHWRSPYWIVCRVWTAINTSVVVDCWRVYPKRLRENGAYYGDANRRHHEPRLPKKTPA